MPFLLIKKIAIKSNFGPAEEIETSLKLEYQLSHLNKLLIDIVITVGRLGTEFENMFTNSAGTLQPVRKQFFSNNFYK